MANTVACAVVALDVVHVVHQLGEGGTAKGAVTHALAHDPDRVVPRLVEILSGGKRIAGLRAAGFSAESAGNDERRLAELLRGADVVHVHRPGAPEPMILRAVRAAGDPALVETNIFGQLDPTPDRRAFACHLFISKMCALRYRGLVAGEEFHARHRVSYIPIDADGIVAMAGSRDEARRRLGLDPERPVIARVGRGDDRKWSPIVVDMLRHLIALVPGVQFAVTGLTPALRGRIARLGLESHVTDLPGSVDEATLMAYHATADVYVTASSIGESFGVSIAEAAALGIPTVTNSTPWVDNAQVETVEHGVTGYLASHPRPFAEAVAALLGDPALRERFGAAAAERCRRLWDARDLTHQLEDLYEHVVRTGSAPDAWSPSRAEFEAFCADYPRLSAQQFRPLTRREQLEVRAAVARERGQWLARDVLADPRGRVGPALNMAVRRLASRGA
jgi:glycosyltransferase involved in cell wall biosynthesis